MAAALARQAAYTLETVAPTAAATTSASNRSAASSPWQPDLAPLIDVAADAATRIVSFTVTEASYHLDAGRLDTARPSRRRPRRRTAGRPGTTIYGALAACCGARWRAARAADAAELRQPAPQRRGPRARG